MERAKNMPGNTHEMDKVGFTADGIAARRTFMDIPRAQDIYEVLIEKVSDTEEETVLREALEPKHLRLVPFFEARYRLLDRLIERSGIKNILEIAAGLAPRGLNWTDDPKINYVELDLPRKSEQKRDIVENLVAQSKAEPHANLHLVGGDALNPGDLNKAVTALEAAGPIVVVHEGLLRYLTFDKKRALAENIRRLLEQLGGCWITPDINVPDPGPEDPHVKLYREKLQARLSMNIDANLFETIPSARTFFESLGFAVEEFSFKEILDEMVSPKRLQISNNELDQLIGWRVAFVMELHKTPQAELAEFFIPRSGRLRKASRGRGGVDFIKSSLYCSCQLVN